MKLEGAYNSFGAWLLHIMGSILICHASNPLPSVRPRSLTIMSPLTPALALQNSESAKSLPVEETWPICRSLYDKARFQARRY